MAASHVDRLDAAGVLDKTNLNNDQKNAINAMTEAEINQLIVMSSKWKAELSDPNDHSVPLCF